MRTLLIVHEDDAGPGVFLDALAPAAAELEYWRPPLEPQPPADPDAYGAVLTFGGAMHPDQDALHPWLTREKRWLAGALAADVPLLGVCLGAQLIAEAAGRRARRAALPEIGWSEVRLTAEGARDALFGALPRRFDALEWHSYEVPLPERAVELARSEVCVQGYRIGDRAWGVQFHAEVTAADFARWLEIYDSDPDAVRVGLDVGAFAAQTDARIDAWHQLGRGLCRRFLEIAIGLVGQGTPAAG